ncbi:MAG: hypothetical protein RIK87_22405 [Fuerstiella sp.]
MITVLPEARSLNRYAALLEEMITDRNTPANSLIVAHNDPFMISRLTGAREKEGTVVLPVNQADWACLNQIVAIAVAAGISDILLTGHSHALENATTDVAEANCQSAPEHNVGKTTNRLLEGARRHAAMTAASKRHFIDQLSGLLTDDELRLREARSNVRIYPLFYIAEGQRFLIYDTNSDSFQPLT